MPWNSLELAKLAVAISTPVTVLAVGWWIKQREQINAELIRKRIVIYDQVVPKANDILCFFLGVGHWQELDPQKVVACKRELDRQMHRYRPFWSEDCWRRYDTFINACFEHFSGGAGSPARLRLDTARLRKMIGDRFDPSWEGVVSGQPTPWKDIADAYEAWVGQLAREIGVPPAPGPAMR